MIVTQDEKDFFVDNAKVFLDGIPARVLGRKLDFPIIATNKHDVVFSWQAVKRIIQTKRGHFKA